MSTILQSTLALFVPGIGADHPDHAFALDDLAVATHFLYRSSNFHFFRPVYLTGLSGSFPRRPGLLD